MAKIIFTKEDLYISTSKFGLDKHIGGLGLHFNKEYPKPDEFVISPATLAILAKMKKSVGYVVFDIFSSTGTEDKIEEYREQSYKMFSDIPIDVVYFKLDQLKIHSENPPFSVGEASYQWFLKNTDILSDIPLDHIPTFSFRFSRHHSVYTTNRELSHVEDVADLGMKYKFSWFKGGKDIINDLIVIGRVVNPSFQETNETKILKKDAYKKWTSRYYTPIVYWPFGGMIYNKSLRRNRNNHLFKQLNTIDHTSLTIEDLKNFISEYLKRFTFPPVCYWKVLNCFTGLNATTDDVRSKRAVVIIIPRSDNEYDIQYDSGGEFYWMGMKPTDALEITMDGKIEFKKFFDQTVDDIIEYCYNETMKRNGNDVDLFRLVRKELISYMENV